MKTQVKLLEMGGTLRAEEVSGESFQYKVFVKNHRDIGWNGNDAEDRRLAVIEYVNDKCKNPQVLEENPLQTGTVAFGQPAITWIMKVKCD